MVELGLELRPHQFCLRLDVQTREDHGDLVTESGQVVQRHLQGVRWCLTSHTGHPHAVVAEILEFDRVETGGCIGPEVARPAYLVQQLSCDGSDRDGSARSGMFGDHRRPVGLDLGDRESRVTQVCDLGEERIVAAGCLGAAFDDVAGDHGTGDLIEMVRLPTEVGDGGTHGQ